MVYTVKGYVGDIVYTREDGGIEYHRQDWKELQHYTNIQVINRFMISGETLFSRDGILVAP